VAGADGGRAAPGGPGSGEALTPLALARTHARRRDGGPGQAVHVVAVGGRRDVGTFIRVPWALYASDPAWVPPLLLERRYHLSRRRPYFAHARARFWIAYRDGVAVGRISAQVDRLHLERYGDATGFFGLLEAEDDPRTFRALFAAAESWLRSEGMRRVRGPFGLSINEESGLLVDGFDTPPMVLMPHGRPWYPARVEEQGYARAADLLAYRLPAEFEVPALLATARGKADGTLVVRPLRRRQFRRELATLRAVFEDAWSHNWGFIPFTEAEFDELGWMLRFVVDDGFVQIAELDGEAIGMLVLLPNVHEAIRDLNGRLLPLGWLKLLWRLGVRTPRTARVALMGVRRRWQRSPLGLAAAVLMVDGVRSAGLARGIREVELSWVLEDNRGMRGLLDAIGSVPYKRYRVYEKALG
jgi:hypothetical protein